MAGNLWHRCFSASPEATAAISNGVVRVESLLPDIQQMIAPGIFIPVVNRLQQVTVGRGRINAYQNGFIGLVNFVLKTHCNVTKVL